MILDASIQVSPEKEKDQKYIKNEIRKSLQAKGRRVNMDEAQVVIEKRSVDARHKNIKIFLKCKVYIGEKAPAASDALPVWKHADSRRTVAIIGSGPAGLFAALALLEHGVRSVIIERGNEARERKRDIAEISTKGIVGQDSNYCFGEGGAGTFSDGKLYTRSDKRGNLPQILRIFNYFGADPAILTAAHPHIGTDKLPAIIEAMRKKIEELGSTFMFSTRCTGLVTKEVNGRKTVCAVRTENTKTGEQKEIPADAVLLATGHSAVDIYRMLADIEPQSLQAKGFAVGVRVEHPRKLIDSIQYHGDAGMAQRLGAAEYRITSQQDGRGVYSFCMCPGGFIVPSATAAGQIVINGMSAAGRNSAWSNAAIVVETHPEDIPAEWQQKAVAAGCPDLAGLLWRTWLEEETCRQGDGRQKAPAQRLLDFMKRKDSTSLPASSYAPGLVASRLDEWLPEQIERRLRTAFVEFDTKMNGYLSPDALIVASETRTSTPVRILRDKESGESPVLGRLYPAGEGSGYSGGIVSSAMDGIAQAQKIIQTLG